MRPLQAAGVHPLHDAAERVHAGRAVTAARPAQRRGAGAQPLSLTLTLTPTLTLTLTLLLSNPNPNPHQVLSRWNMQRPNLTVSREQCKVMVAADGTAALVSCGKGPTLWRPAKGPTPWYAVSRSETCTLADGDQISLDCNDPEAAVFTCEVSILTMVILAMAILPWLFLLLLNLLWLYLLLPSWVCSLHI